MFETFLQALITGLAVGSLYALIALGYTMVYGILKFINFAHSDVFVLGAWISYEIAKKAGWAGSAGVPWYAGLFVLMSSMFLCAVVGFTIERLAYKPLRKAPRLNVLIAAIAVSMFLQNVGQLDFLFGTRPQGMPVLLKDSEIASIGGSAAVTAADGTVTPGVPPVIIRLVDVIGAKIGRASCRERV